jgi:predicted MPP superfamily phosphohydrolase
VVAAGALVEPHFRVLRHAEVPILPRGAGQVRVLHLSDLHLLPRHERRSRWISDLARLQPDAVVVTGDLWSSAQSMSLLGMTLAALTEDGTPGFFVPGNNDYYTPLPPSLVRYVTGGPPRRRGPDLPWAEAATMLEQHGWTDLTHRRTTTTLRGLSVTVTGTDDAHLRRDRYALVAGPIDTEIGIGVTHTPQRRVLDGFAGDGYQLVVAGHTHGGQVRLPVAGALVTNCDLERARARGLSRQGPAWLHVSAGLGTSPYAPIRLCCRPEASLLTLTSVR